MPYETPKDPTSPCRDGKLHPTVVRVAAVFIRAAGDRPAAAERACGCACDGAPYARSAHYGGEGYTPFHRGCQNGDPVPRAGPEGTGPEDTHISYPYHRSLYCHEGVPLCADRLLSHGGPQQERAGGGGGAGGTATGTVRFFRYPRHHGSRAAKP